MPVPRQPRDIRRPHRIRGTYPPETPPGQLTRPTGRVERFRVPRLDPVIRTHVDHRSRPVSQPGEQVRCVTPRPAWAIAPVQPERLRRDRGDLSVEVHNHHASPLKPTLEPHTRPGR